MEDKNTSLANHNPSSEESADLLSASPAPARLDSEGDEMTTDQKIAEMMAECERRRPWRRAPTLAKDETSLAKAIWFDAIVLARDCFAVIADGEQNDEWISFAVHHDFIDGFYDPKTPLGSPVGRLLLDCFQSWNPQIKQLGAMFFLTRLADASLRSEAEKEWLREEMAFARQCEIDYPVEFVDE